MAQDKRRLSSRFSLSHLGIPGANMAIGSPVQIKKSPVAANAGSKTRIDRARTYFLPYYEKACTAAVRTKIKTMEVVSNKTFQVTAASATGGAVASGMGGATVGL